jgi:ABC-type multidrug transport system fused ATPase/permease subunit
MALPRNIFWKSGIVITVISLILGLITVPIEGLVISKLVTQIFERINSGLPAGSQLVLFVGLILGLYSTHIIITSLQTKYMDVDSSVAMKAELTKLAFTENLEHEETRTAEILQRIDTVTEMSKKNHNWLVTHTIPVACSMVAIIVYITYKNKSFGIAFLIGFTVTLLLSYLFGGPMTKCAERYNEARHKVTQNTANKLDNLKIIHQYNTTTDELDVTNKQELAKSDILREALVIYTALNICVGVVMLSILIYICWKINSNRQKKDLYIILVYLSFWKWTRKTMTELPWYIFRVGTLNYEWRWFTQFVEQSTIDSIPNVVTSGDISLENVDFGFGPSQNIYTNLSLHFPAKSLSVLTGDSGSGKSTLFQLLSGFSKIQSGAIIIDGIDINDIDRVYLRKCVVYLEQHILIMEDLSVEQNCLYGTNISSDKFIQFLQENGLEHYMTVLFEKMGGIHEKVGTRGHLLSGGMRRMIGILRVLLKEDVKVYLLDEVLVGLDKDLQELVMTLIKTVCKNKTVIMISHLPLALKSADNHVDFNKFKQ